MAYPKKPPPTEKEQRNDRAEHGPNCACLFHRAERAQERAREAEAVKPPKPGRKSREGD